MAMNSPGFLYITAIVSAAILARFADGIPIDNGVVGIMVFEFFTPF